MRFLFISLIIPLLAACSNAPERARSGAAIPQFLPAGMAIVSAVTETTTSNTWELRRNTSGPLRLEAGPAEGHNPIDGLSVTLLGADDDAIASRSGAPGVALMIPNLPAGSYRVVVEGLDGATGSYTMIAHDLTEIRPKSRPE